MRPTRDKRTLAIAAAVVLAAPAGACSGDNRSAPESATTQSPLVITTSVEQSPVVKQVAPIAAAQNALRTAAAAVPDGQPFDVELEKPSGQMQFEVKVASNGAQHNVVVDATGEQVLSQTTSDRPDDDAAKLDGTTVGAGQALAAASRQAPDALFNEMAIDTDDAGAVGWHVDLVRPDGTEAEFHVDAQSGAVTTKNR